MTSLEPKLWWTADGWACYGSKLQTQLYVNLRSEELSESVLTALPTLASRRPRLRWVAPLKRTDFYEPQDVAMLEALGLKRLAPALAKFWPNGGPVWDALAICEFQDGSTGALLGEGKNYPREMYSGGTQAGKSGSDRAKRNREQIEGAVEWAQVRLGLALNTKRWLEPLDPKRPSSSLFQTANRLTYALWLRSQGVETWFCHLLFLGDRLHHPTTRETWEVALKRANLDLGIGGVEIPFVGHAFLDALDPERELDDERRELAFRTRRPAPA